MEEINYVVIKKKKNMQSEMQVFMKDGKKETYPIYDGKKSIKSSYMLLKKLTEQNEIKFSSAGLRELRKLGLLYYMEEEEFDRVSETMSQGEKNQAPYQKEKETQKIKRIVITRTKDRKADMHVFMNNGEEVVYPIYDGKNLVKSNYVQLKKLAEQNGVEFSNEGLEKLQDSRLLQYMTEEKFARVQEAISQRNKNQVHDQAEKRIGEQPIKENIHTDSVDSASKKTVSRREDNLDFSNIQEFMTHEKETPKKKAKRISTRNSNFTPKNRVNDNDNGIDIPEFKNHKDNSIANDNLGYKTPTEQPTKKTESKLSADNRTIILSGEVLKFIREKKAGIIAASAGAAVVATLATSYVKTGGFVLKDDVSVTRSTNKNGVASAKTKVADKPKETSTPAPTNNSHTEKKQSYSFTPVKAGGMKEYQTIMDALNNADINNQKKVHLSRVYSWLNYYNDSFANNYYSEKDDTKPAHQWKEAMVYYLLFNNIGDSTTYKIFDTYLFDTDESTDRLLKAYKNGVAQDTQAYIISEESLEIDQLINSEPGKEFYKMYKKLFKKYKSLTEDSKYTKEEVVNTFSKLVREHFLTAGKEIKPYHLAVLPIINAFYELSSEIDSVEKLSQGELEYINEKMMESAESRIEEYSNGLTVNRALYGNVCKDALSYQKLKELAIEELKEKDNYNIEAEKRDITGQKAYKTVVASLNSEEASSISNYSSYYKSTKEIKEPFLSLTTKKEKPLSKKEDIIRHGGISTKGEKMTQQMDFIATGIGRSMIEILVNEKSSEKGKELIKRNR